MGRYRNAPILVTVDLAEDDLLSGSAARSTFVKGIALLR
jgi:hypothetical protein